MISIYDDNDNDNETKIKTKWSPYIGTAANGALIGIPMRHQRNLLRCKPSLSVLNFCSIVLMLLWDIKDGGYRTSTLSLPFSSSSARLVDSGGTDLRPHSS